MTPNISRRKTRRAYLVACGALATAGCLDSLAETGGDDSPAGDGVSGTGGGEGTQDGERDDGDLTETPFPDTHPFADRTASVTIETVEADRDRLERLLEDAIEFWNENQGQYLSYSTTLEHRPGAEDPDVLVFEVPTIEECGLHDEGEFAGCATLLQEGSHGALPAEVELAPTEDDWLYRTVIKHELGHVLGLEHDDEPAEIMHESLEFRYPDFDERMKILELRDEWIQESNSGSTAVSRAFDAVDEDDFETAASEYGTASQYYEAAAELIEGAEEVAAELSPFEPADSEALAHLLESDRSFVESLLAALETLREGSEKIADGEDGYDTYNEGVDAYNDTIRQSLPDPEEYVAAVGLSSVVVEAEEAE